MNGLRQRLEDLILYAYGVGGDAITYGQVGRKILKGVHQGFRETFEDNKEYSEIINEAITLYYDKIQNFETPFIAQLLRQDDHLLNCILD